MLLRRITAFLWASLPEALSLCSYLSKQQFFSFCFNNRRYYLEDFISVNTPFVGLYYDIPDYIHGVESENYINPLFVEILSDEFINIYIEE